MKTLESQPITPISIDDLGNGVSCSKVNHDRFHNGDGAQPGVDILSDEALELYQLVALIETGGVLSEDAARTVVDIQKAYQTANQASRRIIASVIESACIGLMGVGNSVRQSVRRESVSLQPRARETVVFRKNR